MLDGVDLEVDEGAIFALLGPNGAGKTTIVHILSTLIGAVPGRCASPATTSPAMTYSGGMRRRSTWR